MHTAMKRLAAHVLTLLFAAGSFPCALGESAAVTLETNTAYRPDLYEWMIRGESAVWYLSRADWNAGQCEALGLVLTEE